MKKLLILAPLILVAGIIGGGYYLYQQDERIIRTYPPPYMAGEKNVADCLPDGAKLVLFIKGLGEQWGKVKSSNFFRRLAEYEVSPLITSLAPPKGRLTTREKLTCLLREKLFLGAMGQDIALGLYPLITEDEKEKISLLLVSKTGPLFKAEEGLLNLYMKYAGPHKLAVTMVDGFKVRTIPASLTNGPPVHYVRVNGSLILSDSIDVLKDALTIAEGEEIPRMVDSPTFKDIVGKAGLASRYGIFLMDEDLGKMLAKPAEPGQEEEQLEPMAVASFSKISLKEGLLFQTEFLADTEEPFDLAGGLVSEPPGEMKSLSFLPADSFLYFGARGIKLTYILKSIIRLAAKENPMATMFLPPLLSGSGKGTLFDEEAVSILGSEWCLTAIPNKEPERMPILIIASEVVNTQKAKDWLRALTGKTGEKGAEPETRIYKDITIWPIKGMGSQLPEYFFNEKFFILGSDPAGVNAIIDSIKDKGPSLKTSKIYTSAGIPPENHIVGLLDFQKVLDYFELGLKKLPKEMLPEVAQSSLSPNDIIVLLRAFDSMSMRTVFSPARVEQNTFIAFHDLPDVRKKSRIPLEKQTATPKPPMVAGVQPPKLAPPAPAPTQKREPISLPAMKPEEKKKAPHQAEATPPAPADEKASPLEPEVATPPVPVAPKVAGKEAPHRGAGKKKEVVAAVTEKEAIDTFRYTATTKSRPDPFASLIMGKKSKVVLTVDPSYLWKELAKVESINLYIYKQVKKLNSGLIKKIEHFTEYFKKIRKVKTLKKSVVKKISDKIQKYALTVSKLKAEYRQKIPRAFDMDLGGLSLVGIIMEEGKNTALIQTPDRKGHTLNVGDIVGNEYGEIVSINENRVVVEEKSRDYLGNISTKTKTLDLPKEEG